MSAIGQPKRATQNRVVALFRDELGWHYLGDWSDREGNSNVEEGLLSPWLHLRGATPADLPVETPREFDFVINTKTARALGLAIPRSLVLRATQVSEYSTGEPSSSSPLRLSLCRCPPRHGHGGKCTALEFCPPPSGRRGRVARLRDGETDSYIYGAPTPAGQDARVRR